MIVLVGLHDLSADHGRKIGPVHGRRGAWARAAPSRWCFPLLNFPIHGHKRPDTVGEVAGLAVTCRRGGFLPSCGGPPCRSSPTRSSPCRRRRRASPEPPFARATPCSG